MGLVVKVALSGDREAIADYGWGFKPDGSILTITLDVTHPTTTGLTKQDELDVLAAVADAIRLLS